MSFVDVSRHRLRFNQSVSFLSLVVTSYFQWAQEHLLYSTLTMLQTLAINTNLVELKRLSMPFIQSF
jgi:hypothetical protein